jgi:hypothetical protein
MYNGIVPDYVVEVLSSDVYQCLVCHASNEQIIGIGRGATSIESQHDAAQKVLTILSLSAYPVLLMEEYAAARAQNLTISLRGAATPLPFSLRFQFGTCPTDGRGAGSIENQETTQIRTRLA